MEIKFTGARQILHAVETLNRNIVRNVESALFQEASIEMAESKRRVPVKTGALRSSGHVERPVRTGNEISVRLAYGGPAAEYALIVHEDLEAYHENGQAKYLESVLTESVPYLMNRIAKRLGIEDGSGLIGTTVEFEGGE